jgi:hypothetical protein
MNMTKIAMLVLAIALALYILIPGLSWGEDRNAPPTYRVISQTTPCPCEPPADAVPYKLPSASGFSPIDVNVSVPVLPFQTL